MKNITMSDAVKLVSDAEKKTPQELKHLQKERLLELVSYVKENSPYFKKRYSEIDLDNFTLEMLPPTTKKDLMVSYEDWVTDREISKAGVMEYIDKKENGDDGSLYLEKYSALTTSGTTGEPMPMLRDSYHNMIHGAMMNCRLIKGLIDFSRQRVAGIIFTDPHVSSYGSFLRTKKAYPENAHNLEAFSPTLGTNELAKKLDEFCPEIVTCYPSAMCAIANKQKQGEINLKLSAIACSAETLTPEMHTLLKTTFHCPILNNYCSTEGGEAAMSCNEGHLHINEDWVIIEPVDKDLRPVAHGEWSDGLLITDLTNYVQPIIRYHMTDRICIKNDHKCGKPFSYMEIAGRSGAVLKICESEFSTTNCIKYLESVPGTYMSQMIQRDKDLVEIRAQFVPGADEDQILCKIEEYLKKEFEKEGCGACRIIKSKEEPLRNKKGGKLQPIVILS